MLQPQGSSKARTWQLQREHSDNAADAEHGREEGSVVPNGRDGDLFGVFDARLLELAHHHTPPRERSIKCGAPPAVHSLVRHVLLTIAIAGPTPAVVSTQLKRTIV